MDKIVEHWIERSQYDLDTAKVMLETGRYLYVAYMCQQSVEKLIKAIIAQQGKENFPIHNLNRLAEISEISNELSSEQFNFLAELTPYHVEARYGDYKEKLSEIIDEQKAQEVYRKTLEIHKWLYRKIRGFITELRREIPIKEIILFGSYAQGNPKEYSDIDLAVISDWFKGKPKIENMQYLSRIAAAYNSLIEALPFTEEEYRNLDKRSFLASIVKSGRNSSKLLEKSS